MTIFQLRTAEADKPRVEAGETCPLFCGDRNIELDLSDKFARWFMSESKRNLEVDTGQILKLSYNRIHAHSGYTSSSCADRCSNILRVS